MSAIDFSSARPSIAAMKAGGVTVVCRYLTRASGPKRLTKPEADAYLAAGLGVLLNFEDGAANAKLGAGQGTADAQYANAQADALGAPRTVAVWYSCDTGASYDEVAPYYRAAKAVGVRPVAFYGPMSVGLRLQAEGVVVGVWVADAASWSGFRTWNDLAANARKSGAHLLQHLDHPLAGIPAAAYDFDEILRPFSVWGSPTSNAPATSEEEDMILIPSRVASTVSGREPVLGFDAVTKTLFGSNGVDFLDVDPKVWKVTHWPKNAAGITGTAQLMLGTSGALDFAISADGAHAVIFAKGDSGTFEIAFRAVKPAPATTVVESAPPVDLVALAKAVVPHLKLAAS